MNTEPLILNTRVDAAGAPVAAVGDAEASDLRDLLRKEPRLAQPEHLIEYCEALIYLNRPNRYRVITAPDEYRREYEAQYVADAAEENAIDSVTRLTDFGLFDTKEIAVPASDGERVFFYVEDDANGTPWRVIGPSPSAVKSGRGQIDIVPLPHEELT
jgi:hypothetical protein